MSSLAAIDAAIAQLSGWPGHAMQRAANGLNEARAVIAELIDACTEHNAALREHGAAFAQGHHGEIGWQRRVQDRLNDATVRMAAALRAVGPQP